MDDDEVKLSALRLYAAVEGLKARRWHWRAWADRMLAAGVTAPWVHELKNAEWREHASAALRTQVPLDLEAAVGYASLVYLFHELNRAQLTEEFARLSRLEYADCETGELLKGLGENATDAAIDAIISPRVAPMIKEADRQWRELFPDDYL